MRGNGITYVGNPQQADVMIQMLDAIKWDAQLKDLAQPWVVTVEPAMVARFGKDLFLDWANENEVKIEWGVPRDPAESV